MVGGGTYESGWSLMEVRETPVDNGPKTERSAMSTCNSGQNALAYTIAY